MKPIALVFALTLPVFATAQEPAADSVPEFPQQQSADYLLRACASSALTSSGRERRKYCAGFLGGVEEAVRFLERKAQLPAQVCPPTRVTARGLAEVYIAYAAKHQKELTKPAAEVAFAALIQGFPCPTRP